PDHRDLFAARSATGAHRADEATHVSAVHVTDLIERDVWERAIARDRFQILLEHPFGEIVCDPLEVVEYLRKRVGARVSIGLSLRGPWHRRPPVFVRLTEQHAESFTERGRL